MQKIDVLKLQKIDVLKLQKIEGLKLQKNEVMKLQKIEVLKLQKIEVKKWLLHISKSYCLFFPVPKRGKIAGLSWKENDILDMFSKALFMQFWYTQKKMF